MAGEIPACQCGSGLRPARCCHADQVALRVTPAATHLEPLLKQANEARARGDGASAAALARDILDLSPGYPGALRLLYELVKPTTPAAAEALIRRLVTLQPNDFWATNELTLILINKGHIPEAEIHARNAIRIAPENPQSHHLMGMVMTEANRAQVGEYHYRKALALADRRGPILLANLAWNLKNQGKMAESRAFYEESVAADASVPQTLLGWARMEEADRNFKRAGELLDQVDKLTPNNPNVLLSRAVLYGRVRDYPNAMATLAQIAALRDGGTLGPNELLEQGRLFDQMGRYQEAFTAFVDGKRMVREISGDGYLADHATQLAGRLKGFFTSNRLHVTPRATVVRDRPQPIFIIGFPRSGTTLVEQSLTAHPAIAAGDELPFIGDIVGMMPRMLNSPLTYPEALAELWMADQREGLDNFRDYYLQRARQFGVIDPAKRWFTDKMPLNETHLGLIGLIFPRSPIIHVIRHPLDVMLSVFSNQLTHGFYCAYALETAAKHYALIADLIAHYRTEMALRYLAIRYEDVVSDQEASVRRMLDWIGEPFDEQCLNFHENKRYARTASYAQVTEPLYDRSRYRYRHYIKELEPILPILEPAITRLGYTIDTTGVA